MAEFYKTDSRKITLREYWNITRSWKALVPWIAARLGVSMSLGSGFRQPDEVGELEIAESEFSTQTKAKLPPLLEQCLQLGFHSPRFYSFENIRRDTRTSFIAMLHRSGEFTLRLMHTVATMANPPVENILVVLLSELNDGTFFFTSDQRARFKTPPGILNNRLIGGSPMQLIQSHQEKLAELALRNPAKPALTKEAMDEVWNRYEWAAVNFGIQRGLYVRMNPEEAEGEQKRVETAQTLTAGGVPHADVLVELKQLQNKKAGWGNAILIFVVSMLLFVGAGSRQWSWNYALMLVPVLFIHELGHYLAMRAFHYRNLRMFFIPFFGAAVAGQHYNVPGWKKVIVSMMGPVPGIVLGVIVGGAGLVLHQPWLLKVALVALILNGFNLLPVLPLDGGWIFHTLFFSRHHMLDAAFRVLAAVALIAGGMSSRGKILMYLGILMLLGIPTAYRMARITRTLRERGVPPGSADDQTIPTQTAVAIIDELKKSLPKGHTNKMVAQQTLQIFETLNAHPPGWLATIGLSFAYVASLGMALVFAGVFTVGQRGGLGSLLASMAIQPKRPVACGANATWREPQAAEVPKPDPITIIANFSRRAEAERCLQELTNRLPASGTAKTFGDSVLLALPAGDVGLRKQWFAELRRQTKTLFVDSSNAPAKFSISCKLGTTKAATELEEELTEYLSAPLLRTLIPPWHPDDRRTPNQRAAHRLARRSFLKAQTGARDGYDAPSMRTLQKELVEAQQQGDGAEVAVLRKKQEAFSAELAKERLIKLKAGEEGPVDPEVIDLAALSMSVTSTNREANQRILRELAQRMGQLPGANGPVDSVDDRFSSRGAIVFRTERTLQLGWVSFTRITDGAPALLDWLCAKGGADFKYDIVAGTDLDTDEDQ